MSGAAQTAPKSLMASVIRVTGGNILEMYDFFVFGYYATAIGKAFFPAKNDVASLLLALMTFGFGFLVRPLGAIVLGSYTDAVGRRKGLIVTLMLMSIGTVLLAFVPGYDMIGLAAPILVVAGRLIQGFSAGAELGSVSVYLAEIANERTKGFWVSWQSASQRVAVVIAAALGLWLDHVLGPDKLAAWGWRIPFIAGLTLVPFIFILRRSLTETSSFEARERMKLSQVLATIVHNFGTIFVGMMMVLMTTVTFYLCTAYTPTFGKTVLHLSQWDSLLVTLCVGVTNIIWLPLFGALSDKVGRKPIMIVITVLAAATAYPLLLWLTSAPSFQRLLVVELWFSFLFGAYNGANVVYLTEVVPSQVRAAGFSLAYSLATCVGGFTPFLVTWLIARTHNPAIPGAWETVIAIVSLIGVLLSKPYVKKEKAA